MALELDEQEKRRQVIRDILAGRTVHNQGELLKQLARQGYRVTQSSVSRDLQELNVVKIKGRYVLADALLEKEPRGRKPDQELAEAASWILRMATAGDNLLVVQTPPGRAPAVAATIDKASFPEIVGSIAGDDTIFFATSGRRETIRLLQRLENPKKGSRHA